MTFAWFVWEAGHRGDADGAPNIVETGTVRLIVQPIAGGFELCARLGIVLDVGRNIGRQGCSCGA